jgi:uncharacterized membrane protein
MLVNGFLLKGQCLGGFDGRQYSRLCYNDIQPLFTPRLHVPDALGTYHPVFPYERPLPDNGQLVDGIVEYPVATGMFMWFAGLLVQDPFDANSYLWVNMFLLAPFGLLAAYLLGKMTGRRALMWAAAPALVLYAFHNWDLPAAAATVAGFYAWWRGRPGWAAVAFGVGATLKLYPVLFLAPLAFDRLFEKDIKGFVKVAGLGMGTVVAINLPFALKNYEGWRATFDFHRLRGPNFDNIWAWPRYGLEFLTPEELNFRTALVMSLFGMAALAIGWWLGRQRGRFPVVQVSAALLIAFLLWNKVHSPQYALWLLPFFALTSLHIGWWIAYSVVDLAVYVGVFRYFYDYTILNELGETPMRGLMIFGVWARAGLLLALFVAVLWVRDQIVPREVPQART